MSIPHDRVTAAIDAANTVGMRSVLTSEGMSAAMADHYKAAYDASNKLNPPPCAEEFHYAWMRYLELTHNMSLATSVGNIDLAIHYNDQAVEFTFVLEQLNKFP